MKDQISSEPRVFGVGLPKTGLTSLSSLMRTIGRENTGAGKQMRRWFFVDKDYQKLLERYDSGNYFCDGPTCLMYREAFTGTVVAPGLYLQCAKTRKRGSIA